MVTMRMFRVALSLGIVALLLSAGSVPAGAEEESQRRLHEAFVGPLSTHLSDLLSDDPARVEAGRAALLAEGHRALAYVRVTWGSEERPDRKARLADLAARLPEPADELARRVARPRHHSRRGGEEWCPFDLPAFLLQAAGRDRVAARAAAAREPVSLVAAALHFADGRGRDGLDVLRNVILTRPELAADAPVLAERDVFYDNELRAEREALRAAAYDVAEQAEGEARARVLLAWCSWHPDGWQAGLRKVVADAPGTPSALLAEQRLIDPPGTDSWVDVAEQEAFATKHAGTEAARRALDEAAFHLSSTNTAKSGEDPMGRLERLADVALRRAAAGPASPADGNIEGFWVSDPKYAPESLAAFREAYRTFYAHHLLLEEVDVHEYSAANLGYAFLHRFAGLARVEAGRKGGVFDIDPEDLEVGLAELATVEARSRWKHHVRFFRGALLAKHGRLEDAVEVFRALASTKGPYRRKAEATLATALYAKGDLDEAAKLYVAYRKAHPDSAYAWFAALRVGHSHARAERWTEAAEAYQATADAFADHPVAGPLAHACLGRVLEESDRYADAAGAYERALTLWDEAFGPKLHTRLARLECPTAPAFDPDAGFTRAWLVERAETLGRTHEDAEDRVLFERGRKLRRGGDPDGAIELWGILLERGMGAELEAEVRHSLGDLLLERALAELEEGRADEARKRLATLEERGSPFQRFVAQLTSACALLLLEDDEPEAASRLGAAIARFAELQEADAPGTDLERRVAAVRAASLQAPREGEADARDRSPYVLLPANLPVLLPDGSKHDVSFRQELDLPATEIYLTLSEAREIARVIDALGGTKRTRPASPMGVAQPGEQARRVSQLISRFFHVRAGHWGGWHVYSYPTLLKLTFLDDELTRARVEFRIRFQGWERLLRLEEGEWRTEEVRATWIE